MSRSMYSVAGNDRPGVVVTFTPNGPATLARDRRHWHVNTWADGFGRWHAEFTEGDRDAPAARLAHVARLAIAHELDQRAPRDAGPMLPHVRVVRMYRRTDLPGHVHYAERDA